MHWSGKANVDRARGDRRDAAEKEQVNDKEDSKPMILKHLKTRPYRESQER